MSQISQPQKGSTCQYFALLYLMQENRRGALSSTDFKDCIFYMTNANPNRSGFIKSYLKKLCKPASTVAITTLEELPLSQLFYVDNGQHTIIAEKTQDNCINVWNPQRSGIVTFINVNDALTTGDQTFPAPGKTEVEIWQLNPVLPGDTATTTERHRQIEIINALSAYLSASTNTGSRSDNIGKPTALMTTDEKRTLISGLYTNDKNLNVPALKARLGA